MGILTKLICASVLLSSSTAFAQNAKIENFNPQTEYQGSLPTLEDLVSPGQMPKYRALANQIASESATAALQAIAEEGQALGLKEPSEAAALDGYRALPHPYSATIFVSMSMGENAIREIVSEYSGRQDVKIVFRGVPEDQNVPEFAGWLHELQTKEGRGLAQITLDPSFFDHVQIEAVPAVVIEDHSKPAMHDLDHGLVVASALGLANVSWVFEQYQKKNFEFASNNTMEIAEEDLRVRARREASQVMARLGDDHEARISRYWANTASTLARYAIPPATRDREKRLHFRFQANENIRDYEGQVIAFAGEVFSAQDVAPFDRRLIIFNPNNPVEVQWAHDQHSSNVDGVAATLLIATEVPKTEIGEHPWAGLQKIVDHFGAKVFLINDMLKKNFQIEVTPTLIFPRQVQGQANAYVIAAEFALEGDK